MSKSNINLSRSEAVLLHREMWNWISEQLEEIANFGHVSWDDVYDLKKKFCKQNGYDKVLHYCFCCQYDDNRTIKCENIDFLFTKCMFCPIKWGTENKLSDGYYCQDNENTDDFKGKWSICDNLVREAQGVDVRPEIYKAKYLEAAKLAREIAELPERDVNVELATMIAEERGIIDYKVKGNRMIYYANWQEQIGIDVTYKVTIRLDTLKEERQKLNKVYAKGNLNRGK